MSLVNDALNQLPDKTIGEGALKSPYAHEADIKPHNYKIIFVTVLALVIVAQISYLFFTKGAKDHKVTTIETTTTKPVAIANNTTVVKGPEPIFIKNSEPVVQIDTPSSSATLQKEPVNASDEMLRSEQTNKSTSINKSAHLPGLTTDPIIANKTNLAATKTASEDSSNKLNEPTNKASEIAETKLISTATGSTQPSTLDKANTARQITPKNKSIITTDSDTFDENQVIFQANRAMKNGDIKTAFRLLTKAMESEPDNLNIRLAVSKLWLNQQQPEKALETITGFDEPEVIALKALIFETDMKTDEAMQLYQQLAASNNLIDGYQLRYAILLENARDSKQAYVWYQTFSKNREHRESLRVFALERMKKIIKTGQL